MTGRAMFAMVAASCMAVMGACGDDEDDLMDAGGDGDMAMDGDGDSAGDGDGEADGGPSPGPTPTPTAGTTVSCGTATCMAAGGGGGFAAFAMPCCLDEAAGTCGMSIMGSACMEGITGTPGQSDPRCPGIDVMGFIQLPSCCTDTGLCGIDASMFGQGGCVDLESAKAMSSGQFPITFPEPQACGDSDADAGMDDDAGS